MADPTFERANELLTYDPETGILRWKSTGKPTATGLNTYGYMRVGIDGKSHRAHRIAWLLANKISASDQIDHRDGNKTNNRLANLRNVVASMNMQNQFTKRSTKKIGSLPGSHWNKKNSRWTASIGIDGKAKYLGSYDSEEAAHRAYLVAKRKYHPGFTG